MHGIALHMYIHSSKPNYNHVRRFQVRFTQIHIFCSFHCTESKKTVVGTQEQNSNISLKDSVEPYRINNRQLF